MKKALKITIVVVPIILLAFIGYFILSRGERLARKYISSANIVKTLGVIKKEKLSKLLLLDSWHEKIWMVQDKSPDKYLGKEIIHYGFIVKGQPGDESDLVLIVVMMSEDKAIGGYSYLPDSAVKSPSGGIYSIQGFPMSVFTKISAAEWISQWEAKYTHGVSTGDLKTAEDYVKNQGYRITASRGLVSRYTLEKSMLFGGLFSFSYAWVWALQTVEPGEYISKEICCYEFDVRNHPLENRYAHLKLEDFVRVIVMISEGKVIGGTSYPNPDLTGGGVYAFDGRTVEEKTGLSLQSILDNWKKKYAD